MDDAPPPLKHRLRFTLRQLGVLVVFLGMGIALVMQYRELASLRAEVRKLRAERGELTVEDPSKLYAIQAPQRENKVWKWRVSIPEGSKYWLYVRINGVPCNRPGFALTDDHLAELANDTVPLELPTGESEINLSISHDPTDGWVAPCTVRQESRLSDCFVLRLFPKPHQWPNKDFDVTSTGGVSQSQVETAAGGVLLLLFQTKVNMSNLPPPGSPVDGMLVWMIPVQEGTPPHPLGHLSGVNQIPLRTEGQERDSLSPDFAAPLGPPPPPFDHEAMARDGWQQTEDGTWWKNEPSRGEPWDEEFKPNSGSPRPGDAP